MSATALDVTPGGAIANSYCSIAEADQYVANRPVPTLTSGVLWASATSDQKTAALLFATILLDSIYVWEWWASNPAVQALQWPRTGVLRKNMLSFVGNNEIPTELKNAEAEFARQLLQIDRTADLDVDAQGILSFSAGPISLTFKDDVYLKIVPDAVYYLIPPHWGAPRSRSYTCVDVLRA